MSKFRWAALLSSLIVLAGPVRAQDEVTIVQELTVSVKSGMERQFEEFVKAFADVSRRQKLENYWLSAQSMSGEPVYRFSSSQGSWGGFGNPGPQFAEVLGEQEAARLAGLAQASIASMRTAYFEQHSSMSRPPVDMDGPPEALIYFAFTLNPGGAARFLELSSKTAEASAATEPGSYFVAALPSFGAPGARTIVLLPHLSDLDTPQKPPQQRVMEHFGQAEGARINALAGEAVANIEATLFRTRPDLNYQPGN
jgi:hypothetical protein